MIEQLMVLTPLGLYKTNMAYGELWESLKMPNSNEMDGYAL